MPDSLEVAVQRKRIEELQRYGQNTQDAEAQLRAMLDAVTWRWQVEQLRKRANDQRSRET